MGSEDLSKAATHCSYCIEQRRRIDLGADDKGDTRRRRKVAVRKEKWPIVGKQHNAGAEEAEGSVRAEN
ncbi:hypothetical protein KFK09_016517 [Dendrobium nobile]|uniref:Uncharacterized protein n=1 Tax=Dendrobium nobile TaxID=94219 RepID=A0A8T3B0V7_DENNO|nr:hypothetical protein KFK09_016517 [Dendrobium nobile]